ncbi:MAG TPA: dynamin family protein, partial [Deinococcales bacterium]|nr:dynamin family protein [Deinococcales bacterium]
MDLVSPQVRGWLAQERDLLADLSEHLGRAGAPEPDLRTARLARQGIEETFLLVVVGEFNSGKSSFINAIFGRSVLAEGVTPTTDRITILVRGPDDRELPPEPGQDDAVLRRELPFSFLDGVALVDTPGTNAVIRRHQALTEGFLPRADLVLFLTSADRPFTESERQFLELTRSWGRKVLLVVNKVDLLDTEAAREEVRSFVARNAREVLGLMPPVFMVSVKRHKAGGDEGFTLLSRTLVETLNERDRTRLKLASPLGVVEKLAGLSRERSAAALALLEADTRTLADLDRQLDVHGRDLQRDLETHLRAVDGVLDGIAKRGEVFLDDTFRIGRTLDLLNAERVRGEFERRVIGDAPQQLERRVNEVIDSFIERNIHFWDHVLAFLAERQKAAGERDALLGQARFHYDRQGLLDGMGHAAMHEVEGMDRETLALRLAGDAQGAVIQSSIAGVGGIGLGAALAAGLGTLAADFTGILLGLGLLTVGFYILPRRKALAKRELQNRLTEVRVRLREV